MSKASDFAAALETAAQSAKQVISPPGWTSELLSASVTDAGGCVFGRFVELTPEQALSLGQWLVSTYE